MSRFKRRTTPGHPRTVQKPDVIFIRNTPATPGGVVRLGTEEDRRMLAARMACCFGIRDWHLDLFSRPELEAIVQAREYHGVKFEYPDRHGGAFKK